MKKLTLLISVLSVLLPFSTQANTLQANKFAVCLNEAVTEKEQKQLITWIFLAISANNEIKPYVNATPETIDKSNKTMGALVTRLITEDCPEEAYAAMSSSGQMGVQYAFGSLGETAMMGLMSDPEVMKSIMSYSAYLDKDKLEEVFKQ